MTRFTAFCSGLAACLLVSGCAGDYAQKRQDQPILCEEYYDHFGWEGIYWSLGIASDGRVLFFNPLPEYGMVLGDFDSSVLYLPRVPTASDLEARYADAVVTDRIVSPASLARIAELAWEMRNDELVRTGEETMTDPGDNMLRCFVPAPYGNGYQVVNITRRQAAPAVIAHPDAGELIGLLDQAFQGEPWRFR